MEQTASKGQAMSSFTKKIGQTIYKVNVFFAENVTATFENKLLHLMQMILPTGSKVHRMQSNCSNQINYFLWLTFYQQEGVLYG